MKNKIDLHIHSIYSDGEFEPDDLIKMAVDKNIYAISITDHDTVEGNKKISVFKENIKIIPGIELSTKVDNQTMHILGYGIDINNEELNKKIIELKNRSIYSVIAILAQLKKDYNIVFTTEEIQELFNKKGNIGRPNIAKLCVKHKYSNTAQEAFDKYLIDAHEKTRFANKGISYYECINLIIEAGGIPVLAHPHTLNKSYDELITLIKHLKEIGLQGIEVYHSKHTLEQTEQYLKIAQKLNLLISGGSDYHGKTIKPEIKLGTGINNNLNIKSLSLLKKL